jgi:hypothetical protein
MRHATKFHSQKSVAQLTATQAKVATHTHTHTHDGAPCCIFLFRQSTFEIHQSLLILLLQLHCPQYPEECKAGVFSDSELVNVLPKASFDAYLGLRIKVAEQVCVVAMGRLASQKWKCFCWQIFLLFWLSCSHLLSHACGNLVANWIIIQLLLFLILLFFPPCRFLAENWGPHGEGKEG